MIIFFIITETYIGNLEFSPDELQIIESIDVIKVRIPNWEITEEIGAPELPSKVIRIALPYGARVKKVEITEKKHKEFIIPSQISYAQPPIILSQKDVRKSVKQRNDIYLSSNPYPEEILKLNGVGTFGNYQICELVCTPFQYLPREKRLIFYNSIKFSLHYEGGTRLKTDNGLIKQLLFNPDDVLLSKESFERGGFQYVIITAQPFDTVFQRLAFWKKKKGIPAQVRDINWIISNYPGEDSSARIRNYLKTLADSNTRYVLLGGDVDYIPTRFAYAMTCSANIVPGREDTMPCDLYYADLQGNWDLDNDHSYGEIEDSIDLYPDLIVGRASVNTISEAQKFVEKVLIYEKNPPLEYLDNGLFAAEILWTDPYTDQGIHKDKIGNESFPAYFELTKLYQSLGNETREAVMAAIRQGQNLINHDGHGWINLISVGGWPHRIYTTDFDTITNGPKYGILYSIGCWTNAFDLSSISESFLTSPNGGGVAFIGNSSYGWGSPGNPGFGYSDRFDSRFFYSLFKGDNFHLGEALALAKAHFIPYSREENVYRWHQYEINLLGDPEMPVWTKVPDTLAVFYPQSIPSGNARILITVKDRRTNIPLRNALVCLMKGNESYSSGYTDASGSIFLNATANTPGNFDLTISGHNYLPLELSIPIISGPYVNFGGWLINDIFGNNDHIVNPGEEILLPVKVVNCGNAAAQNIQLKLSTVDTLATVLDSLASIDSLLPGDSLIIDNAFGIRVRDSAINGNCIEFSLEFTFNNQSIIFKPNILVGTPIIDIDAANITTLPAMPGQVESLYIDLKNYGFGAGHSCRANLSSIDPYTFVLIDTVRYGEIPPESIKVATEPFVIYISPFCPLSHLGKFLLNIRSENYLFTDTVSVVIGETGFFDDMESGTGLWTSGGINNLWHISQRRSFSQINSWYCGDETSGRYINNMDCYIQTIPFMVQKNSLLSFYRWFQVPIYGSDGIYVIVIHNGIADTLDFIGTGGALKKRPIQSDWFCEKYLLKDYSAGDTIQIRFAFVSDNDGKIGEGFYIDDVNVEYKTSIEEVKPKYEIQSTKLEVYPNPFQNQCVIKFQFTTNPPRSATPHSGSADQANPNSEISLRIYDVSGRLVKSFNHLTNYPPNRVADGGTQPFNQIVWFGDDDSGRRLPAGVYFVRLGGGDFKEVEKAVLLR